MLFLKFAEEKMHTETKNTLNGVDHKSNFRNTTWRRQTIWQTQQDDEDKNAESDFDLEED